MPAALPLHLQTVVITGAARGLGRAIATAFHAAGSNLVLLDYDAAGLHTLEGELAGCSTYAADLSSATATRDAIDRIAADHPRVHTLIHNAGVLTPEAFADMPESRWNLTFNVGIQAAYLFTRAYWKDWLAAGSGCAIYVSSNSGIRADWGEAHYAATKHALEGFSAALALEGTADGVFTHTVTPGKAMRTPMSEQNYSPELKSAWVDPTELTPAFLYLAMRPDAALSGKRLNAWELSQAYPSSAVELR